MPAASEISAVPATPSAAILRRRTARLWAARDWGVAPALMGLGITFVPRRDDPRLDHRGLHPADGRLGIPAGPRGRGPVACGFRSGCVPRLPARTGVHVGRFGIAL